MNWINSTISTKYHVEYSLDQVVWYVYKVSINNQQSTIKESSTYSIYKTDDS